MKVMDIGGYQTVIGLSLVLHQFMAGRGLCNKHQVYFMFVRRLCDDKEICKNKTCITVFLILMSLVLYQIVS